MAGHVLRKLFFDITLEDFKRHPIWEFLHEDPASGDWVMVAKDKFPVKSLSREIICVPVRLASGKDVWARMQNINLEHPDQTEEFMDLQFEKDGKWIGLTPYYI